MPLAHSIVSSILLLFGSCCEWTIKKRHITKFSLHPSWSNHLTSTIKNNPKFNFVYLGGWAAKPLCRCASQRGKVSSWSGWGSHRCQRCPCNRRGRVANHPPVFGPVQSVVIVRDNCNYIVGWMTNRVYISVISIQQCKIIFLTAERIQSLSFHLVHHLLQTSKGSCCWTFVVVKGGISSWSWWTLILLVSCNKAVMHRKHSLVFYKCPQLISDTRFSEGSPRDWSISFMTFFWLKSARGNFISVLLEETAQLVNCR